jgi:hypothetical protein
MPKDMNKRIREAFYQAKIVRTRSEPYGDSRDGTLIVCHNDLHAQYVALAFPIVGGYYLPGWHCALGGRRFRQIIVFTPVEAAMSDMERERYYRWMREFLPTKLAVGCTEIISV